MSVFHIIKFTTFFSRFPGIRLPPASRADQPDGARSPDGKGRTQVDEGCPAAKDHQGGPRDCQGRVRDRQTEEETIGAGGGGEQNERDGRKELHAPQRGGTPQGQGRGGTAQVTSADGLCREQGEMGKKRLPTFLSDSPSAQSNAVEKYLLILSISCAL